MPGIGSIPSAIRNSAVSLMLQRPTFFSLPVAGAHRADLLEQGDSCGQGACRFRGVQDPDPSPVWKDFARIRIEAKCSPAKYQQAQ
jgi:hypothetical protein